VLPVLHLQVGQPLSSKTFPNLQKIAQTGPQTGATKNKHKTHMNMVKQFSFIVGSYFSCELCGPII
jgi:hypothetical protein